VNQHMPPDEYTQFYGAKRTTDYAGRLRLRRPEQHSWHDRLRRFIERYGLKDKKCLEIGAGHGVFQDCVEDYSGTDIAPELSAYFHKRYRAARDGVYPFDDGEFDAIWTIATYEHIPNLDQALEEIHRLLKPGGVLFFAPAWQCRPWAPGGYARRPYSELNLRGKLIKAAIPLRESLPYRLAHIMPKRICRHLRFLLGRRYRTMKCRKLQPNYDVHWTSDSDACNHMDPHDAILWFESNGFECLSHPLHLRAIMVRSGALEFVKIS